MAKKPVPAERSAQRAVVQPLAPATLALATIPAGQSLSNSIACLTGVGPQRLRMPAAWLGGMRDTVTFQTGTDNINFFNLYRMDGQEVEIVVIPGAVVMLADLNIGTSKIDTYVKVRAGTSKLPIVQPADRVFTFVIG